MRVRRVQGHVWGSDALRCVLPAGFLGGRAGGQAPETRRERALCLTSPSGLGFRV